MASSISSEMEHQLTTTLQGIMKEAMSMLQVKEATTTVASASTRGPKCHR
jgi:hypothetical protein